MKEKVIPQKLKKGDKVAIIAPARTLAMISQETRNIANQRFADLGLELVFGSHVEEKDDFMSSSIESRIDDLHWAFSDKSISAIFTVIGGFNCNQLLGYIDWALIKENPKIFCGFSDVTILNNAIYTKTGLITYSGPHYSTFGQKLEFDYTLDFFKKCLLNEGPFKITSSETWTDDEWYLDQDNRKPIANNGYVVINEGAAKGTILGSNLCTFNLLQGTPFFPKLNNSILFLEDDYESRAVCFDRDLQSLIHLPAFRDVKGIVIGRFQKKSEMNMDLLKQIIVSKKELKEIPVIANVDFGHTEPRITFPIGGSVEILADKSIVKIEVLQH